LEVDLRQESSIARAEVCEFEQRITSWTLSVKDGERWRDVAGGDLIGSKKMSSFKPVRARSVRLNILDSNGGAPSLVEFHLFGKPEGNTTSASSAWVLLSP